MSNTPYNDCYDDLRSRIRDRLLNGGVNQATFAASVGVTLRSLKKLLNGEDIAHATVKKIVAGMERMDAPAFEPNRRESVAKTIVDARISEMMEEREEEEAAIMLVPGQSDSETIEFLTHQLEEARRDLDRVSKRKANLVRLVESYAAVLNDYQPF